MIQRFAGLALTFAMLSLAPSAYAGVYTFTTLPFDGSTAGPPGSTIGWGYTVNNLSQTDWLVTTGLNTDSFLDGTAISLFDFPDLAPGTSVTPAFDPNLGSGLYQLTWDLTAADGTLDSGLFTLSAEWWNGDPLNGGSFLTAAPDTMAGYSATVSSVPEPSCFLLLAAGMLVLYTYPRIPRRRSITSAGTAGSQQ
jgi:hypothetical protein